MLRVGAAMVDITPKAGAHLAGSAAGERRPAQSVLDPLYAKAVVFESGGRRLCIVALDVTIVTEEYTALIRKSAAERFGFEHDAVMVHAIQTHSAPSCGNLMLDPDFPLELPPDMEYVRGAEKAYSVFAATQAIEAIGLAVERLQPAQIGVGSGIRAGLAFNRRVVTRDGSVVMPFPMGRRQQPLGPTHLRYMEGPDDPEVGVLCVRNEEMKMVAMLLHFTCHPVNVFATDYHVVSADWPGAWAAGMQAAYGASCVPLVINGCCGNINPWDPFDPDFVPDHRRMGASLTDVACRVVRRMKFSEEADVDWRLRHVPLQYREVPKERQAEVDKMLSAHPQPKWSEKDPTRIDVDWFHAASTRSIEYTRRRHPEFPYEVQVFRIGETAIVGLPGEPFVEGQLAIKVKSPAYPTYVAHCCSHYVGYLPTREAGARGGHEANPKCTWWAKFAPGSLETVSENAVKMVREVFHA